MRPIAAAVVRNVGYAPELLSMAVALGASREFSTPIEHQTNQLVMGPGGYWPLR